MPYKVAIRKNATGEIRIAEMDFEWDKGNDSTDLFWWTEGNFGCDCNRYLEFERAGGHDPDDDVPDDQQQECGHTAYSVLYAEMPDGKRVPIDEEPA